MGHNKIPHIGQLIHMTFYFVVTILESGTKVLTHWVSDRGFSCYADGCLHAVSKQGCFAEGARVISPVRCLSNNISSKLWNLSSVGIECSPEFMRPWDPASV